MPPLHLEEFSDPLTVEASVPGEAGDEDEGVRLAAYEEGYGAGWEDAITAQNDARAEREAEVARHLQALSFGYHEARQHLLHAIEPLLQGIAASVLPAVARQVLAPMIAEALLPLAERMADAPITLRIAPGCRISIERMLAGPGQDLPFQIIEDSALSGGQAMIDAGQAELRIDLDASIATILSLIQDFFDNQQTERAHAG